MRSPVSSSNESVSPPPPTPSLRSPHTHRLRRKTILTRPAVPSRPAARFSRDSPPPSIPLRSPYLPPTPSFQIPLRPAGPQRFASESSTPALAHTAPAAYWRPDGSNQLPARPVQRYRSPPLAGIAGLPVRGGWESASTRGRDSRGGWGRDEYRSEGGEGVEGG